MGSYSSIMEKSKKDSYTLINSQDSYKWHLEALEKRGFLGFLRQEKCYTYKWRLSDLLEQSEGFSTRAMLCHKVIGHLRVLEVKCRCKLSNPKKEVNLLQPRIQKQHDRIVNEKQARLPLSLQESDNKQREDHIYSSLTLF